MKKQVKNIIIVSALIVVLGTVMLLLLLTGNGNVASSSATSSSGISLVSKKVEDISSMQVQNKNGTYTLVPTSDGKDLTVQELSGLPISTSLTSLVGIDGYNLSAATDLGTVQDLSQYGLSDPQTTVKTSFKDGSSYNYSVGIASPTDTTKYYICPENSKHVYMVTLDENLFKGKNTFIDKVLLSLTAPTTSDGQTGSVSITDLSLSGSKFPQKITLKQIGTSMYTITAPIQSDANQTATTAITSGLTSLSASEVVAVHPDSKTLKDDGFSPASAVLEFAAEGKQYKLSVGNKTVDSYYIMKDGTDIIFKIDASSVSGWAEANLFSLESKIVFEPEITKVSSITVTVPDGTYTYNIARAKNESSSTQDKLAYTYTVTNAGGTTLTYLNYSQFFNTVVAPALLEQSSDKPNAAIGAKIEYHYFDSQTVDTVEYISAGNRRYTAVVNGTVRGLVAENTIADIQQKVKLFDQGQTVPEG